MLRNEERRHTAEEDERRKTRKEDTLNNHKKGRRRKKTDTREWDETPRINMQTYKDDKHKKSMKIMI